MRWVSFLGTCNSKMFPWIFPKIICSFFSPKKPPTGFLVSLRKGNSLPSRECHNEGPGCHVENGKALVTTQNKMANSVDFAYVHIFYLLTFWAPFKAWPHGSLHCPVISCNSFHCTLAVHVLDLCLETSPFCSSNTVAVSTDLQEHQPLKVKKSWIWRFFLALTFLKLRWQMNAHIPRAISFHHLRKINECLVWLCCMLVI